MSSAEPIQPVAEIDEELQRVRSAVWQDRFRREAHTFARFIRFLWPYKDKVILMMLLIIVGVPLGEIGLFMYRYLVDEVILNEEGPFSQRLKIFYIVLGIQLIMWIIHHSFSVVRQIFSYYLDLKVSLDLKRLFYNHLHTLSLSFLRTRPIGEHMFRAESDISGGGRSGLLYMITDDVPQVFRIMYSVVWAAALLSMVDWRITLLIFLYIVPYSIGAQYFYTKLKRTLRENKIEGQRVHAQLRDAIAGAKVVKGFGRIEYQIYKYTRQLIRERRVYWKYFFLSIATHHGLLWALRFVVTNAIWLYAFWRCMTGYLSYGECIVTIALSRRFERPLEEMVRLIQQIRLQLVPAERVLETLDVEPEIVDTPGAITMPPIKGKVEFRNVTFEYIPGVPVLREVNFAIEPGESVAFVGPSGAGKSTIMYLLLRLYEPKGGQILIDDIDIRTVRMFSFQQQIGVVLQETFLFGGSFADNIRYGKLKATAEEVIRAAKTADLHDFIMSQPDGYDRDLGEGKKLSGGQQQRLGIARAIVRDPRILILDEATSSLDSRIESRIINTIYKAMKGRTTLMISHRLVTVTHCDRILVVDKGQIIESGTHEELLKSGGLYKTMWAEQTLGLADDEDR